MKELIHQLQSLSFSQWINSKGEVPGKDFNLSFEDNVFTVLFFFQSWCPGCHSHGFPSLLKLKEELGDKVNIIVAQTVFEGHSSNTFEDLQSTQKKYNLEVPFVHDSFPETQAPPQLMKTLGTRGTPWFTIINPDKEIIANDFHLNTDAVIEHIQNKTS